MKSNALQILKENYRQGDNQSTTFVVWLQQEADSDPNFFRWLFEDDTLSDFSVGKYSDEWQQFLTEIIRNTITVTFYNGKTELHCCQISKSNAQSFFDWLDNTTDVCQREAYESGKSYLRVYFQSDGITSGMKQFINECFL